VGIATALAAEGTNLMLNGFADDATIETARSSLAREHRVDVCYSSADLRSRDQIRTMIADAEAAFGSIDVLVNNAGVQHLAPVEDFPASKWDEIIAVNLTAAFETISAALPGMKRRGRGRIINIASAHGLVASPNKAAYVAAKHGLVGLTKAVALETAEHGITVNSICPGYVQTPLTEGQPGVAEVMKRVQPLARFVAIEEVAALAVYLAGDAAASITGSTLTIDGGWTAQ